MSFYINNIPAVLYGEPTERVFIFIHGQCGNKYEAERFAKIAAPHGWQVLGIDLPEHGGRQDDAKLVPQDVIPELLQVMNYAKSRWKYISVRAISIGSWFALGAFANEKIEKCLLSSPLLDMENMIENMMKNSGVSEERLKSEGEIPTNFGPTLSWDYLCFVRQNPVHAICSDTAILYAAADEMIPRETIDRFAANNSCRVTLMNGGEHWFHTEQQLEFMKNWEEKELAQ